jgi:plasmid replication initiation protein
MRKKQKTEIALIKKSNELIEARYKFDIWETRVFLSVLGKIHKDDDEFETYRIYYKDIIKTFGLKPTSSYEFLRNAAKSLMDKKVTVDYEENGHKREKIYHLIRNIDLLKEGRVGASDLEQQEYVDIVVESQMRPLLLHLQRNFTAYDLRNVVNLGVYPVRVYELLKQYETIGYRTLEIDDMKKMFNLTEEYPKFANFFQKVIAPAIKEVNKYTDLKITKVDKIKDAKKIVALTFFFERKNGQELQVARKDLPVSNARNLTLFEYEEEPILTFSEPTNEHFLTEVATETTKQDALFAMFHQEVVTELGVSPSVFMGFLETQDEASIRKALRVTQRAIKEKKAKNKAAFFIEALKKGFTDPEEAKTEKQQAAKGIKEHNKQIEQLMAEIELIKMKQINDKIRSLTSANPKITEDIIAKITSDSVYQRMINIKETNLGRKLIIDDFREDKMLRDIVMTEIMNTYESEFSVITSIYQNQMEELKKSEKK